MILSGIRRNVCFFYVELTIVEAERDSKMHCMRIGKDDHCLC